MREVKDWERSSFDDMWKVFYWMVDIFLGAPLAFFFILGLYTTLTRGPLVASIDDSAWETVEQVSLTEAEPGKGVYLHGSTWTSAGSELSEYRYATVAKDGSVVAGSATDLYQGAAVGRVGLPSSRAVVHQDVAAGGKPVITVTRCKGRKSKPPAGTERNQFGCTASDGGFVDPGGVRLDIHVPAGSVVDDKSVAAGARSEEVR